MLTLGGTRAGFTRSPAKVNEKYYYKKRTVTFQWKGLGNIHRRVGALEWEFSSECFKRVFLSGCFGVRVLEWVF